MQQQRLPQAVRLVTGVTRPAAITISVNDQAVSAYPGESLATALLAHGKRSFRCTQQGEGRGPYCNMGVCFDCVVSVSGHGPVRACMTPVTAGMAVTTDER